MIGFLSGTSQPRLSCGLSGVCSRVVAVAALLLGLGVGNSAWAQAPAVTPQTLTAPVDLINYGDSLTNLANKLGPIIMTLLGFSIMFALAVLFCVVVMRFVGRPAGAAR